MVQYNNHTNQAEHNLRYCVNILVAIVYITEVYILCGNGDTFLQDSDDDGIQTHSRHNVGLNAIGVGIPAAYITGNNLDDVRQYDNTIFFHMLLP